MITFSQKGDFKKTTKFLEGIKGIMKASVFDKYGKMGVQALSSATPVDSGETARSWYYEITRENGQTSINWLNGNINDGVLIAIILQYGHGTGTGGYVKGTDYINPAMKPVFEKIANDVWEEVKRL